MTKAERKEALAKKLHAQKASLFRMQFHVEVALAEAKKANARRPIRQHLRIAHRSLVADHRKLEAKLGS